MHVRLLHALHDIDEYQIGCTLALPWEAARHDCRLRGANLAVVESDEENELIASYANDLLAKMSGWEPSD